MNQRKLAVLAACGLAGGAAFAQSVGTRRIEGNGKERAGLNIGDGHSKEAASVGTTAINTPAILSAADATAIANGVDTGPAAQMQQAGEKLAQADAKPATTAQAPQQQQTGARCVVPSKSVGIARESLD